MNELFRREAAAEPAGRVRGRVFVARPVASGTLASLLTVSVIAAAVYLGRTDYARHQVVPGRLEPSSGMVWVRARQPGLLTTLAVTEGDRVTSGALLAIVDIDGRRPDGGPLAPAVRNAIEDELQGLDAAMHAERSRSDAEQHSIAAELQGARAAAGALQRRQAVAQRRLDLARRRADDVGALAARRYASRRDVDLAGDQILGLEEQLLDLAVQRATLGGRERQLDAQRRQVQSRLQAGYGNYLKDRATIRQRLLAADAARQLTIDAPVSGRVSALLVHPGATVDPTHPLLALSPAGDALVARLYVPSRAVGFVSVGQDVRLMMDAYPHQQFGALPGHVTSVARTAVLPAYLSGGAPVREPVYPVTVEITRGASDAFTSLTLRAGMTLRADVVLERHSLLQWWLSPLRAVAERL